MMSAQLVVYSCNDCPRTMLLFSPVEDAPWCDHAWHDGDELRPFVKNPSQMVYFGTVKVEP